MINLRNNLKTPIKTISLTNADLGHADQVVVLKDITLIMPQGVTAWIRGPSGCGKSTILRTFAGLINPLSGKYQINGLDIKEMSFEEFIPYRLNIGYAFELGGLLSNKTVLENIMLPLQYHNVASYEEMMEHAQGFIQRFGLSRYQNERPANVSGGVRKAACVARAFVLNPDILILDEPTAGLNDEGIVALRDLLRDRTQPRISLITSRDDEFMSEVSDVELTVKHEAKYLKFKDLRKARTAV